MISDVIMFSLLLRHESSIGRKGSRAKFGSSSTIPIERMPFVFELATIVQNPDLKSPFIRKIGVAQQPSGREYNVDVRNFPIIIFFCLENDDRNKRCYWYMIHHTSYVERNGLTIWRKICLVPVVPTISGFNRKSPDFFHFMTDEQEFDKFTAKNPAPCPILKEQVIR